MVKTAQELRRERRIGCVIVSVLLALAGSAWLMLRVVTPFSRVPTKAMAPTIHADDRVAINRLAYRFGGEPRVGDVALYRSPVDDTSMLFRIVGGPGDTLQMQDNVLFRNGQRVHEPYIMLTPDIPAVRSFGPLRVPAGHYFFLGDNRDNANDSRFLGFVSRDRIRGRMTYVLHIGKCAEQLP